MWPFSRKPVVPVLRFTGPIGMVTPLRPGLSIAGVAGAIEKAFDLSKLPSVAVLINSPGGSPVQSNLIFKRIRQLAEEKKKKVYVFCEDVAASGGYWLACAADEIYADQSSIVGSIGVIAAGFGFVDALKKLGVERRVYTAGTSKNILDPFKAEKKEDVERLLELQEDVHESFKNYVRGRRAGKLKDEEGELFTGAFWTGARGLDLGLVDGLGHMHEILTRKFGEKVEIVEISAPKGWGLKRFGFGSATNVGGFATELPEAALNALETRALWSRFGL